MSKKIVAHRTDNNTLIKTYDQTASLELKAECIFGLYMFTFAKKIMFSPVSVCLCVCPRTRLEFGERCFAFAGPAAWNSLPSSVQELTDTTAFLNINLKLYCSR